MPNRPPPTRCRGPLREHVLPAGTTVWRVHNRDQEADVFTAARQRPLGRYFGGRRFDGTIDDPYGVMYVSPEAATTVVEEFLHDVEFTAAGRRMLQRAKLANKSLTPVRTAVDLVLLRLVSTPDLVAANQDGWLATARGEEYAATRQWAHWLRAQAPWAQGFIWESATDRPRHTVVLFGDRCSPGALKADDGRSVVLDDAGGAARLGELLEPYGVRVRPPSVPRSRRRGVEETDALVFLNYRSVDEPVVATLLDHELCRRLDDARVFRDVRSIPPGAEYPPELLDKVRRTAILAVVIGCRWLDGAVGARRIDDELDWVRREIVTALEHRVHVVPIYVGLRRLLVADELPAELRGLTRLQLVHLPHGYALADIARLADRIMALLRHDVASPS